MEPLPKRTKLLFDNDAIENLEDIFFGNVDWNVQNIPSLVDLDNVVDVENGNKGERSIENDNVCVDKEDHIITDAPYSIPLPFMGPATEFMKLILDKFPNLTIEQIQAECDSDERFRAICADPALWQNIINRYFEKYYAVATSEKVDKVLRNLFVPVSLPRKVLTLRTIERFSVMSKKQIKKKIARKTVKKQVPLYHMWFTTAHKTHAKKKNAIIDAKIELLEEEYIEVRITNEKYGIAVKKILGRLIHGHKHAHFVKLEKKKEHMYGAKTYDGPVFTKLKPQKEDLFTLVYFFLALGFHPKLVKRLGQRAERLDPHTQRDYLKTFPNTDPRQQEFTIVEKQLESLYLGSLIM